MAADLPPEFEEHLLQGVAGGGHNAPARGCGTGEGDHVDIGAGGQKGTDLRIRAGENIDDACGDVGVVGDQLAKRESDQRGVRRALQDDSAAGGQGGRELRKCELIGVVVGDDGRHHPACLFLDPPVVLHAAALDVAEVLGHRIGLQQIGVVADDVDRRVQLGTLAERLGGADLRDGERGKLVAVVDQGPMKLIEAADPKLAVRRPVGGVERAPRRSNGRLGVTDRRVGSVTEHGTGRGVDRRKRPFGLEKLSVDQQAPVGQ